MVKKKKSKKSEDYQIGFHEGIKYALEHIDKKEKEKEKELSRVYLNLKSHQMKK